MPLSGESPVSAVRQAAPLSPGCMGTSFLFLDNLAAIMPEPVKETCDSLSQLVLLACNVKGVFRKLDFILYFLH